MINGKYTYRSTCAHCYSPIPERRLGPRTLYCSNSCNNKAYHKRKKLKKELYGGTTTKSPKKGRTCLMPPKLVKAQEVLFSIGLGFVVGLLTILLARGVATLFF